MDLIKDFNALQGEIRVTQIPSPPRTYQFSVWLENEQLSEGFAFLWDFGDGGCSEFPSPVHTFTGLGEFQIHVNLYKIKDKPDPDGESNIAVNQPPYDPPTLLLSVE